MVNFYFVKSAIRQSFLTSIFPRVRYIQIYASVLLIFFPPALMALPSTHTSLWKSYEKIGLRIKTYRKDTYIISMRSKFWLVDMVKLLTLLFVRLKVSLSVRNIGTLKRNGRFGLILAFLRNLL